MQCKTATLSVEQSEWRRRYMEALRVYGGMSAKDAQETFDDWFLGGTPCDWWKDDPVRVAVEEVKIGLVGVDRQRIADGRARRALKRLIEAHSCAVPSAV